MREFKCRCSGLGAIMTNPRNKSAVLSETAKTYCQNWVKEQLYDRQREISNKYMEKGNIVEDNSIDFISEILDLGFLIKNETYYENDHLTGTPDVILKDSVIDVKNSWDCFTFPLFDEDIKNKDYMYQLQGYMELTGRKDAKLIYILSDTPLNLIEREAYYWCKNNGYDELDMGIYKSFLEKMTYKTIDKDLKYKIFNIQKDEEIIKSINERVEMCRNYIKTLVKTLAK